MRNKYLFLSFAAVLTVVLLLISSFSGDVTRNYIPRKIVTQKNDTGIKGAIEWVSRRRNNQITHTVDIKDIERAKNKISALKKQKSKSTLGLEWKELGPDNIGGRTRALLIDKDNPSLMYAGGVSGGLWKSTTAGQTWSQVTYTNAEFGNPAVVSICQAINGDIYFGTGEGMYSNSGTGTGGIEGAGMWKSTDHGETFSKIESTWDNPEAQAIFVNVNKLAADPDDANSIYAATKRGLHHTSDGGKTWESTTLDVVGYDTRISSDVKIASDGSIIASIGNIAFIKRKGVDDVFKKRSGLDNEEDPAGTKISSSSISRLEFAFAPSDPNYVYCAAANSDQTLKNIYQSKDKGDTWTIIGNGGSDSFQPFGTQGAYDNVIAVYPDDPEKILVGGLDIWKGNAIANSTIFQWEQLTFWSLSTIHPFYIHADQHAIVFNPADPTIIFIGSDGGISRVVDDGKSFLCKTLNTNYNVTQFYSVAYSGTGEVLGGTQDNGSLYINFKGNTPQSAKEVMGGDGAQCEFSKMNPNIFYTTLYYGGLKRTNDLGGASSEFYSPYLLKKHGWNAPGGGWASDPEQGAFVTPIALWETRNDPSSKDTINFIARRDYFQGEKVIFKSHNAYDQPIEYTIMPNDAHPDNLSYVKGDTIKIHDRYQSLFALGLTQRVWITRKATNFNDAITDLDWWSIFPKDFLEKHETVEYMAFSNDGNNLFFSTNYNNIYRSSNLKKATTRYNADDSFAEDDLVVKTQLIGNFGNRSITSIATDPQNIENIVVTLGNYGNNTYIYFSSNAASTTSTNMNANFYERQGNLPTAPVYSSVISYKSSDKVIIGTENGVFSTENITGGHGQVSETCVWNSENTGLQNVPVFMIRQQTWPNWYPNIHNEGYLYIGTHGRGIFSCETLKAPVAINENPTADLNSSNKINIDVYPNPIIDVANISYNIKDNSNVKINLYNIQGKLIRNVDLSNQTIGKHNYKFNMQGIQQGTYILNIVAGNKSNSKRVVVY
ncbi:MAG: T9SS type A sorting domain-containing protein [Bacteroidetes bacterium]|nr:T9SS type A sorting domain-containing protein [Bacteroidota bacterium]